jgi:hypothetical protein
VPRLGEEIRDGDCSQRSHSRSQELGLKVAMRSKHSRRTMQQCLQLIIIRKVNQDTGTSDK